MNESEFLFESQKAIKEMREAAKRSSTTLNGNMPFPSFVKVGNKDESKTEKTAETPYNNLLSGVVDLPILNRFRNDPDFSVIIALILILYSDNCDPLLLLILLYILL